MYQPMERGDSRCSGLDCACRSNCDRYTQIAKDWKDGTFAPAGPWAAFNLCGKRTVERPYFRPTQVEPKNP